MNKVIERLRSECILNAEEDSGFSRDVLWLCNEAEDMSAELDIAKQRIEQLEDRLEVYSSEGVRLGENCDGIACRDETIKCLDKRIEQLEGDIQILELQRDATHISRCPRCNAEDKE